MQNSQSTPSDVCKMDEFADWQVKMTSLQTGKSKWPVCRLASLNDQFADWHVSLIHPSVRASATAWEIAAAANGPIADTLQTRRWLRTTLYTQCV